ncbi:hypothetical protein SD81_002305 [Tolypothrix campylonemoides VB511288]|nr:hypothetical protein SD81_002305 [Tolypothrix campylonemoides VB511288]
MVASQLSLLSSENEDIFDKAVYSGIIAEILGCYAPGIELKAFAPRASNKSFEPTVSRLFVGAGGCLRRLNSVVRLLYPLVRTVL